MQNEEMTHVIVDLESGSRRHHRRPSTGDEDSVCFSDADNDDGDVGSCYSQFYSTYDGSYDDQFDQNEIGRVTGSRRVSSVAGSDCSVDIEGGAHELKLHLGKEDRDCRICHMNLVVLDDGVDNGVAMELGCSCKDDLAMAHKQCAETWFKIKGNKTCEICNSIARNIVGFNETTATTMQIDESNAVATTTTTTTTTTAAAAAASVSPTTENSRRSCLNGHRFLNFLLACMVFAFVISWLFRFNIPS